MCRIFSVVLNTRLELSLRQHYQFCSNKDNSLSFVTKQRKKNKIILKHSYVTLLLL